MLSHYAAWTFTWSKAVADWFDEIILKWNTTIEDLWIYHVFIYRVNQQQLGKAPKFYSNRWHPSNGNASYGHWQIVFIAEINSGTGEYFWSLDLWSARSSLLDTFLLIFCSRMKLRGVYFSRSEEVLVCSAHLLMCHKECRNHYGLSPWTEGDEDYITVCYGWRDSLQLLWYLLWQSTNINNNYNNKINKALFTSC